MDIEHNHDYQAFAVLFVLAVLALLFAASFRIRFSAVRNLPRFGTVGAPMRYTVSVKNLSPKLQAGLTLLELPSKTAPSYGEWLALQMFAERSMRPFRVAQRSRARLFASMHFSEGNVPALPPGAAGDVAIEALPTRRGLLHLKGLLLARPDPIGLFRAFSKLKLPQSVLILPKRYRLPPVALPGAMKYQEGGVAMASSVGQSEDFVALRDYRHGDPLRHIHWRSWARTGKPVVKEFEDEFFVRHALILDTFLDDPYSEVFEEAVSVAASFACTVQTQESLLDLLFVGTESYCFTAGRGLAHADQMLEILASVKTCGTKSFAALEALVLRHVANVSGCICVLTSWDETRQEFVRKLRMLQVPMLVLVVVPPGTAALDPGPMRDDPTHFHVLTCADIERGLLNLN